MSSCCFTYGMMFFVSPAEVVHIRDALQILIPIPNSKTACLSPARLPHAQDNTTNSKRPSGNSPNSQHVVRSRPRKNNSLCLCGGAAVIPFQPVLLLFGIEDPFSAGERGAINCIDAPPFQHQRPSRSGSLAGAQTEEAFACPARHIADAITSLDDRDTGSN